MKTADNLKYQFKRIDGKGYKAYKDIKGQYSFPQYRLIIDHVQGDPFAAPSRIRVRIDRNSSGFEEDTTANRSRTVALGDFLTRQFYANCKKLSRPNRGTGKSGLITIAQPGQEILERSSMVINENFMEARFFMGLPTHGRRISGKDADIMFFKELPAIVAASLFIANQFDPDRMNEGGNQFGDIKQRIPMPQGFNPYHGKNRLKITVPRTREIVFGRTIIDLWDIDQLVDISQTRGIGYAAYYATRYMDGKHTLRKIVERVIQDIDNESLDILVPYLTGDLARFRSIELAAAINRMRTLKVK